MIDIYLYTLSIELILAEKGSARLPPSRSHSKKIEDDNVILGSFSIFSYMLEG